MNIDLTKYRAYDPAIGRWWQEDRLADQGDLVSLTPYNYSLNNPVRYNDPYGDCPKCKAWWTAAVAWLNEPLGEDGKRISRAYNLANGAGDIELTKRWELMLAIGGNTGRNIGGSFPGSLKIPAGISRPAPKTPAKPALRTTKPAPVGADGSPQTMPKSVYRSARSNQSAIKDVTAREKDQGRVSFRESQSNPIGSQPVLTPGGPFIEVDVSKLPPGTVILDGGMDGNAPGHVSVTAQPEEIVGATVNSGKYPKKE